MCKVLYVQLDYLLGWWVMSHSYRKCCSCFCVENATEGTCGKRVWGSETSLSTVFQFNIYVYGAQFLGPHRKLSLKHSFWGLYGESWGLMRLETDFRALLRVDKQWSSLQSLQFHQLTSFTQIIHKKHGFFGCLDTTTGTQGTGPYD